MWCLGRFAIARDSGQLFPLVFLDEYPVSEAVGLPAVVAELYVERRSHVLGRCFSPVSGACSCSTCSEGEPTIVDTYHIPLGAIIEKPGPVDGR